MKDEGFTLIEVLIALMILAIAFIGIYEDLILSIKTANYSYKKAILYNYGFERVLLVENYGFPYSSYSVYTPYGLFEYKIIKKPTLIPSVYEIDFYIQLGNIKDYYVYYKKY